jgi:integrase
MKAAREHPSTSRYALKPHTLYCLFGLLSVTGMRLTEALNLKFEDIDWKNGVLTIAQGEVPEVTLDPVTQISAPGAAKLYQASESVLCRAALETPSKSSLRFNAWNTLSKH